MVQHSRGGIAQILLHDGHAVPGLDAAHGVLVEDRSELLVHEAELAPGAADHGLFDLDSLQELISVLEALLFLMGLVLRHQQLKVQQVLLSV